MGIMTSECQNVQTRNYNIFKKRHLKQLIFGILYKLLKSKSTDLSCHDKQQKNPSAC